ncbi:3-(3-hydroxy-phenyl)propionate hydroxylase [Paecilomyces variotii No. 5]|uniref:3-(3-hydroxy-phenyl)propionate hydroxylase n=1 Tax=Byssochlamys spectabilis (strain No. 5 / NBRC 109023) TaxID=1356009 RepID=V5HUM6_BYSSN|nr:3-(3-hydroxy-phenyl)propionate hydroxylase [Paecilomyces variotii No. 5]
MADIREVEHLDVLIVGGGPVGLVTAYQLALTLPPEKRIRIIEQHQKSSQDQYGRAITLFPRTSEMLDQLGLAEALSQQCFACRDTVSYDRDGNEVQGRGWAFMENMKDTVWDFALVLRQKYQEEIFRQALKKNGVDLEAPMKLIDVTIDDTVQLGGYRVIATIQNELSGSLSVVKCRYLVGADGGRSFVRRALQIPFEGSTTEDKWVRIDGIIETNLPKPRTYCAIESPTHGNVLWAALDRGATRIGFAFTAERQKAYPKFDEEAAVKEAIASVKPFSLSFKEVHWYTIYSVGQRVAQKFCVKDCVFLAGDACHTHSSGAAQGMNTGIHDAVNLGWKLSLVLQGKLRPEVLKTYESERRPNVQKLINYDKDISRLMTMQLPIGWSGDPNADPNVVLGQVMAEAAAFTSGISIRYEADDILNVRGNLEKDCPGDSVPTAGERGPDVELQKPGTFETTRLHRETPNNARFYVVIFAGNTTYTSPTARAVFDAVRKSHYLSDPRLPVSWRTIIGGKGSSPYEMLGTEPLGKVLFDRQYAAHARYGVDIGSGAILVLRPDGWIGTIVRLAPGATTEMEQYFGRIMQVEPLKARM